MFSPLFQIIPRQYHDAILNVERHMVNALNTANEAPARNAMTISPDGWPAGSGDRLKVFLRDEKDRQRK